LALGRLVGVVSDSHGVALGSVRVEVTAAESLRRRYAFASGGAVTDARGRFDASLAILNAAPGATLPDTVPAYLITMVVGPVDATGHARVDRDSVPVAVALGPPGRSAPVSHVSIVLWARERPP
jgi:hypothetical protein